MLTSPLNLNHFVTNLNPPLDWNVNEDMMLIEHKYKPAGAALVSKFSKMFNDILNVTFKGMITKIKDKPDTLKDYPLSVQAYYI